MENLKANLMPNTVVGAYSQNNHRYEGVKGGLNAELKLVESCMGKCGISFADNNSLSSAEAPCMQKCFTKYFDATLLVDKELSLYTHGTPYRS